jgi:hypothetical protein
VNPFGSVTEAVGTFVPHWVELVATGAVGNGFTVTVDVDAEIGQPLTVAVPVNIVAVETGVANGLVVPTTLVPLDQETLEGVIKVTPENTNLGLDVAVPSARVEDNIPAGVWLSC